jgi:hypothetical protein
LGWKESELDDAPTPTQRRKRAEKLEAACTVEVQEHFQQELEKSVRAVLGKKPDNGKWLNYQLDTTSKSPVLLFNYNLCRNEDFRRALCHLDPRA